MRKLFAGIFLAAIALPLQAQVTHVTVESGKVTFNFPVAQDALVAHFEMCANTGVAPVVCAAAGAFAPISITSKAADATQPGYNLYTMGPPLPASLTVNRAGESTMIAVRACTGTATGSGCAGIAASNVFILDLSSPTNLRVQ